MLLSFCLHVGLTNSRLLECNSSLVSSLNPILLQTYTSNNATVFVTLASKCVLFQAAFLAEILPFSLWSSWRTRLIYWHQIGKFTFTHHLSCSLPLMSLSYPDQWPYHLMLQLSSQSYTHSLLDIPCSIATARWLIIFANFTIIILVSLQIFTMTSSNEQMQNVKKYFF